MTFDLIAHRDIMLTVAFTLPRMMAALSVSPFFAQQFITGIARQVVIISLTTLAIPMVHYSGVPDNADVLFLIGVLTKEVAIGMLLGFVTGMAFWIAEGTGFFIDNQRGSSMAEMFDPMSGESTSPFGLLFARIIGVFFFVGGGFMAFLTIMYDSYVHWPVFSWFPKMEPAFPVVFLHVLDKMMGLIVTFAAPLVIAMFIAEFGMGLMNRFSPQLNVFFLAMPVKSGIAAVLIIFYLVFLVGFLRNEFSTPGQIRAFYNKIFE